MYTFLDKVINGHQYLRFGELSREREDDGTRAYEAIVFIGWDAEHERYAWLWLDSTGGLQPFARATMPRRH